MFPAMGADLKSDRHVLVVGGAGYVGNVLVRRLLAEGHRVRVLDRLLYDHGSAIAGIFEAPGFDFVRGDLRDEADVERSLEGVTDVVMLASLVGDPISRKYPELARDVGEEGSMRFFDGLAGRGIDRFVFTSTCSNYGLRETSEPATEESDLAPLSIYAETKVAFEQHVLNHRDDWDCCPVLLRIATAYGLSQRMRFDLTISEFTRTLATGEELVVYDADTWRPYCHVDDISGAIITSLESPEESVRGEVFNVGHSEENYTKRMVVEAVQEHLGGSGKVSYVEGGTDPRNYRVSFEKITDRLGFEAQHRVPETVGRLIAAIEAGAFTDIEARPNFYGNHMVVGLAGDPAAIGEAADGAD
jgi:nucleoside-diphosphate-sugar epimerase